MTKQSRLPRRPISWILLLAVATTIWVVLPAPYRAWLEPRVHAATISVTNTNDDGPGSLRNAIVVSNQNMGASPNVINFNIPGSGVQTISLGSGLPIITAPVIIDGATQPGFAGTPIVELRGPQTVTATVLEIDAGSSTVRGLRINGFGGNAISLDTNGNNIIQGNFIGTEAAVALGIFVDSSSNTIGGTTAAARNVISNCQFGALAILGTSNVVQGNYLGTDTSGTIARGNAAGIVILGSSNVIGGALAGAANLISGNRGDGISASSTGNVIQGNRIGTDVGGNTALGNGSDGIRITGGSNNTIKYNLISGNGGSGVSLLDTSDRTTLIGNLIGVNSGATMALGNQTGILIDAPNNIVGPAVNASSDINIVAGNVTNGIAISGSNNLVRGNMIGNSPQQTIPNGHDGILITGGSNTIGGTVSATTNVISGNSANGIEISGSAAANQIVGNWIGTRFSSNTTAQPNGGDGILLDSSAGNNTIGGVNTASSLPRNFIAYNNGNGVRAKRGPGNQIIENYVHNNAGAGVLINDSSGQSLNTNGDSILGNRIYTNGGLGIDLAPAGVTPNDAGDADLGPNETQNFPVLSAAVASQGKAFIRGSLNSKPNSTYQLEFFVSNSCDASGSGEAEGFLGSTSVSTNGNGNASFEFYSGNGTNSAQAGQVVSATATDTRSNTSELSPCLSILNGGTFNFGQNNAPISEARGSATLIVWRDGSGAVSVDYATSDGTATAGLDYTAVSGTLNFADGEAEKTITIPIINDSLAEGPELFQVNLSNPKGGASVESGATDVAIDDDELPAPIVYGLTSGNQLVSFNAAWTQAYFVSQGILGEKVIAIDFRPATGELYALSASGRLYTVNQRNVSLVPVGPVSINDLNPSIDVGFDFNPVTDRIRVAYNGTRNIEINPNNGAVVTDTSFAFAAGDANAGHTPRLLGLAHTNNLSTAQSTTVYGINWTGAFDATQLVTVGSIDGTPVSPAAGQLFTVGQTHQATADFAGFDIADSGQAFATFAHPDAGSTASFFKINLATGEAQRIGELIGPNFNEIIDIAIQPAERVQFSSAVYSVNETAGTATITITHTAVGGNTFCNYTTSDGTAKAGSDYLSKSGSFYFAPGEKTQTFTVPILDDSLIEGVETVNLTLTVDYSDTPALVGSQSTATIAIMDESTEAGTNPIDNADFFVRQHYSDFLSRGPDTGGLEFWTNQITQCFNYPACTNDRRVGTSAAFFIENEFQQTGFFIHRFYEAALGRRPSFAEFTADRGKVVGGVNLESGKQAFGAEFVQRTDFLQRYPGTLAAGAFVDALIATAKQVSGIADLETRRDGLLAQYNQGANQIDSRVRAVRTLIDDNAFSASQYNAAFVLMQYFGYLQRGPDQAGYDFWLDHVNNRTPNNYRTMVCAFITSAEYQRRFSPLVTRSDHDCSP